MSVISSSIQQQQATGTAGGIRGAVVALTSTSSAWAPVIVRLGLAVVMFPHGAQKLLGWFGGYGFQGTMGFFTQTMGMPAIVGFLVIMAEFFGPLLLLAGAATRFASASLAAVMAGAMILVQWQHGFFMNWFGNQKGEGIEYSLLFITMAISLVISGAGRFSVDRTVAAKLS